MGKQARKMVSLALAGGLIFGMAPVRTAKAEGLFDDGPIIAPARTYVGWITEKKEIRVAPAESQNGKRTVYPGMTLFRIAYQWESYTMHLYNERGEIVSSAYVDCSETDSYYLYHPRCDDTFWADWDDVLVTGEYKAGMQPSWMEEPPDPSFANSLYMSDSWTYVKPEEKLPTLSTPEWKEADGKVFISFDPVVSGADGYGLCQQYWFRPEGAEEMKPCGRRTIVEALVDTGETDGDYLKELMEECGPGDYYVSLRLMSHDITTVFHSDWSELSEAYREPVEEPEPDPSPTLTSSPTPDPSVEEKDDDDDDDDDKVPPPASVRPKPRPVSAPSPAPAPTSSPAPAAYRDVPAGSQYAQAVSFVTGKGLFQGMREGQFVPEGKMSRAMVLAALGRMDGADVSGTGPEWYQKAVAWAVERRLSDGSAPTEPVSRQELATLLYRHAGSPAPGREALAAPDGGEVALWAREAMAWAVETGILEKNEDGRLLPAKYVTRAQAAVIFQRYLEWRG